MFEIHHLIRFDFKIWFLFDRPFFYYSVINIKSLRMMFIGPHHSSSTTRIKNYFPSHVLSLPV